jgi:outer membrane protein OmpA-like peptidoglycan-associated protein
MLRYFTTLAIAIFAAAFLTTVQARAEKVIVYREGQPVEPQDVADVLGKTRSIRLLDDASATPAKGASGTQKGVTALSLPVQFAFDSSEILPAARTQLDALAQGIKLLAPDRAVLVEGHTDATGDEAYNLGLSRARAQAVRDYLVGHHGIAASRLKTVGYGEQRPIQGSAPHASVNRRVQFRGS